MNKDLLKNLNLTPHERELFHRTFVLLGAFSLITLFAGMIAMIVMEKHQPMIVPKIIGMEQSQAERVLSSKGLLLKVMRSQYDERVPIGLVSEQNPKANFYVKRGQTI